MNEYLPFLSQLLSGVVSGMPFMLPEIALVITFLVVILADLFFPRNQSALAFWLTVAGILTSAFLSYNQTFLTEHELSLFAGSIALDKVGVSFKFILAFAVLLFAVFIKNNSALQSHNKGVGDLYMLIPGVLLGLNLMVMSTSLLMIYISIEMVSIASYLMVGYASGESKQTEASMKYALFGSACSAVMLYGISLLYGFTGTINILDSSFISHLATVAEPASALAIVLTLVGIGFKLSFAPLHFWSPDVYEGAPTPVTAFLSTAPKIAGFAILLRFLVPFYSYQSVAVKGIFDFEATLAVIGIATMVIGNFAAVWQNDVKRMLAYSSIGHTGFALMAIIAFSQNGVKSLLFYFAVYVVMNMAAFMLAGRIEEHAGTTDVREYKGLGRFFKLEMACFVVVLVSLTGLPPTGGFIGKLFIFSAAFEKYSLTHSVWMLGLLITGAITTVVSLFYYFKIPLNAYLRQSEKGFSVEVRTGFLTYVIAILTICVILLGIFPSILAG